MSDFSILFKQKPHLVETFENGLNHLVGLYESNLLQDALDNSDSLLAENEIATFEEIHDKAPSYTMGSPEYIVRKLLGDYYNIRGLCYKELNNPEKALEEFRKATKGNVAANLNILELYQQQKEYTNLIVFAEHLKIKFEHYFDIGFLICVQVTLCHTYITLLDEQKAQHELQSLFDKIGDNQEKINFVIAVFNETREQSQTEQAEIIAQKLIKLYTLK